jgi:catecholate siderophore receptor
LPPPTRSCAPTAASRRCRWCAAATGAPGGLINFISKTGREEGGYLQLSKGLDFSHTRQEFGYGGKLAERTRFYIGGYYRVGDGGREGAAGTEKGGQVRMNLTREFNGGFVRFSFKHLDDQTPTFLPTPVRYVNGKIEEIPGLDPRTTAFYNAAWPSDNTLTPTNGRTNTNIRDGLTAKSDVFGAEVDLDAGYGVKVNNKFRWSKNSGRFIGIFPGSDVTAAPAGTTFATDASRTYTGNQFTAVIFNTNVNDVGLMANDLKLSKQWDLGAGGRLTGTAGLFNSAQDLEITWNFNQYSLTAEAQGARLLNVPGVVNGSAAFGGCCMNYQDSKYSTTAPYAAIEYEMGPLIVDASVRQDRNTASGARYQTNIAGGTASPGTAYDLSRPQTINYAFNNESFTLGANYRLNRDLAVFARYSDGASYLADRITFFNEARLTNGGSSVIPTNEVKQFEGGVKWRSQGLSLFATLFSAQTDEINVDPTTTPIRVTRTKYDAKGLELEGAYRIGGFSLNAGVTYTDATVKSSTNAAIVGKTPKRQAKFVYQFMPSYAIGDLLVGGSIVGTSDSKDDSPAGPVTVTLPGYTAVNLFANYQLTPTVLLMLGINNVTNTIGYTEANDGRGAARSINGRTSRATVKVTF